MKPFLRAVALSWLASASLSAGAQQWTASWASSQQIPEPSNSLTAEQLTDATLRQVVHLSVGGSAFRVRVSNAFGTAALHLTAHVAVPRSAASDAIDPATDKPLLFNGAPDVVIPPAADYWSDPIAQPISAGANLAVTLYLDAAPARQTSHPGSRATSYLVHGNHLAAASLDTPQKVAHWFFLSGVDVSIPRASAVVALGDSITDGHGATTDGNDRWPDVLARRIAAANQSIGVVNEGIGGNHLLTDGLGPNTLARFDRDVLAQSAVRTLIVLEGVNDLGADARAVPHPTPEMSAAHLRALESSYTQIVERAHAHGIFVIGATITPYTGSDYYHPNTDDEAARTSLNAWIRTPGHFDAVVDLDHVTADPAAPTHLLSAYDSGDHLHPSVAGYKAMADAISLSLLSR